MPVLCLEEKRGHAGLDRHVHVFEPVRTDLRNPSVKLSQGVFVDRCMNVYPLSSRELR